MSFTNKRRPYKGIKQLKLLCPLGLLCKKKNEYPPRSSYVFIRFVRLKAISVEIRRSSKLI